jgi:hypothetical protein
MNANERPNIEAVVPGIDVRLFASTDYEKKQACGRAFWSTLKTLTVSFIIRAKARAS